jgi:hypothetical protein
MRTQRERLCQIAARGQRTAKLQFYPMHSHNLPHDGHLTSVALPGRRAVERQWKQTQAYLLMGPQWN